jgi:hypothetical protein
MIGKYSSKLTMYRGAVRYYLKILFSLAGSISKSREVLEPIFQLH